MDSDTVIEDIVFSGVHSGALATLDGVLPPTGRKLEGRLVSWLTIEEGLVIAQHVTFDRLDLMAQLGFASSAQ